MKEGNGLSDVLVSHFIFKKLQRFSEIGFVDAIETESLRAKQRPQSDVHVSKDVVVFTVLHGHEHWTLLILHRKSRTWFHIDCMKTCAEYIKQPVRSIASSLDVPYISIEVVPCLETFVGVDSSLFVIAFASALATALLNETLTAESMDISGLEEMMKSIKSQDLSTLRNVLKQSLEKDLKK